MRQFTNGNFFGELTNFGDITILTNYFNQPFLVWIFGVYFNHTFFESIIFPASRKHARRCYFSRKSVKSCLGVTPVTYKQFHIKWSVGFEPTPFDFWLPTSAILVGIIQIHTNFGCLKWLVKMVKSPKNFRIWALLTKLKI